MRAVCRTRLGLAPALDAAAVKATESVFYNRFGQTIHTEKLGRNAGYAAPQYSIHRGNLQTVLSDAFTARAGAARLVTDITVLGFAETAAGIVLRAERTTGAGSPPPIEVRAAVACDGIHSAIRKQMHPGEGDPRYSGFNMWRGVSRWRPYLSGSAMIRIGWLAEDCRALDA